MIIENFTLLAQAQPTPISSIVFAAWTAAIGALFIFLTGCIQLVSFGRSLEVQKANLKAQIKLQRDLTTREFNKLYDEIRFETSQKVSNGQYNYEEYVLRFWNLQLDQYLAWIQGYVPNINYQMWMKNLRSAYQDREEKEKLYKGESYRYGYGQAKKELESQAPSFFVFIEKIHNQEVSVQEIMKQHRNNPEIASQLEEQEQDLENRILNKDFATI
ncbi:MAG: hypothetical protein QNJ38_05610 [Prochloraceae cyanobacterium]|nr:hypothetical protein [Prochloraceae cyanobacterium]